MSIQDKTIQTSAQRRWALFKETVSEYSFSLRESAFVMLRLQGSVGVLVSMLNRLYGWQLRRYMRENDPYGDLMVLHFGGNGMQLCPFFYYRDRVSHRLYLLVFNPSCNISDAQKDRYYDTFLIVQGADAFVEQQHIFSDLSDKMMRSVPDGDSHAARHETLRHLISNRLVHTCDYFDFSRCEALRARHDACFDDERDMVCYTKGAPKSAKKSCGYAKAGLKEDYQREKQVQQIEPRELQLGLFDDMCAVSERQAGAATPIAPIRSSLLDDMPAHVVDMSRHRQLYALQEMGEKILNTLWLEMCN